MQVFPPFIDETSAESVGMRFGKPFTLIMIVLVAAGAVGCGGDTAQVSGRVMYEDGTPILGAVRTINLRPAEESTAKIRKAATSKIAMDGTFQLNTRKPGDGVYKGQYVVTFMVLDSPHNGNLLIPEEYTYISQSPFTIDIQGDRDDLEYELKKLE